jgi:hypothetical protein
MMVIAVIAVLILVGLVLAIRDNNKTVNEMIRFQLVSSSHIEQLCKDSLQICKEVADLLHRIDELESQAKQQEQ